MKPPHQTVELSRDRLLFCPSAIRNGIVNLSRIVLGKFRFPNFNQIRRYRGESYERSDADGLIRLGYDGALSRRDAFQLIFFSPRLLRGLLPESENRRWSAAGAAVGLRKSTKSLKTLSTCYEVALVSAALSHRGRTISSAIFLRNH